MPIAEMRIPDDCDAEPEFNAAIDWLALPPGRYQLYLEHPSTPVCEVRSKGTRHEKTRV